MKSKVVFDNEYGLYDRTWWNGHFWPRCFLSFRNYLYVRFTINWFFCKSYKFRISEFYAKCSKYIPVPSGLFWFWFRIFPFFRSERTKGTRIQFLNRKKFRFILILWVIIWPRLDRIDQNYRIFGWALCSDQLNLVSLFWEDDTLIIEFNSFKLDYVNPNLGILKWQSNNTLISPRK